MPALDQAIALPAGSVMVMMLLLKVAATCATPTTTFFFSFLRARPALLPALFAASAMTYLVTFFLPAIALAGPLRVRALVWVRWPRTGRLLRWRRPR